MTMDNELNIINLINTGKEINNRYNFIKEINDVVQVQSVAKDDRKNSYVCLLFSDGSLKCFQFYYNHNFLSYEVKLNELGDINFHCKNDINGLKLNYLADGETISLSCINSDSNIQVQLFNKDFIKLNQKVDFPFKKEFFLKFNRLKFKNINKRNAF